jgi:iron complex transport system permease protein
VKAKLSPFAAILLLVLFVTALALTWFNFNIALP